MKRFHYYTPAEAVNKKVDWSVSFKNANSTWAAGKKVTDYVTVTPTSDGSLTATVANLGEFGEQIKITVTSRDNPTAKAECTVDYGTLQRNEKDGRFHRADVIRI